MVLFNTSALTRACLLARRTGTQLATPTRSFIYLIKKVPANKVPHPEHLGSINMWRNLFLLAGIPVILLVNYNAFVLEEQHPKREPFRPYEHMRFRNKKFPWGDGNHSLFHNEYYNALPEGYETEDDYLEKLHHGKH